MAGLTVGLYSQAACAGKPEAADECSDNTTWVGVEWVVSPEAGLQRAHRKAQIVGFIVYSSDKSM